MFRVSKKMLFAIEAVLDDLASGRHADRLICGDVGFGKTEVALRAAFVAAMDGCQVAVVVPTTLLARQHAQSFRERFRGFPLKVRSLSRFVGAKEAADTRKGLADGSVQGDELIEHIKGAVAPAFWEATEGAEIKSQGEQTLVVKATPEVQEQVAGFLGAVAAAAQQQHPAVRVELADPLG